VCEAIAGATAILIAPVGPYLSRRTLEAARGVKLVQFLSVGYEKIDIDTATELGVPVANNAGFNAVAVAEHALMMILVLLKRAFYAHHTTAQGKWVQKELVMDEQQLMELRGKNLGILGLGSIGMEVAKRARSFGAHVLYNKRTRLSEAEEKRLGIEHRSFEDLIRESDILSVHVPLTDETEGMIGGEQIAMMKNGAILINTARSGVVDETALAEALREGKLSGAGIDVPRAQDEIPKFINRFRDLENVVLTPHVASGTKEAGDQFGDQISNNLKRLLDCEKPLHLVNDVWPN